MEFIARIYGIERPVATARAAIERLGLVAAARSNWPAICPAAGSSGWRSAPVRCQSPKLLLLDEPTAGVDPKARREFWNEIHGLAAHGLTVLVTTHYMDEAERCNEIAYIAYGKLLVHGTVEQVIAASHLTTYAVSAEHGDGLNDLSDELTGRPGVDMVAQFGTSLHVSGRDAGVRSMLRSQTYRKRPGSRPGRAPSPRSRTCSSTLMGKSKDNFQ